MKGRNKLVIRQQYDAVTGNISARLRHELPLRKQLKSTQHIYGREPIKSPSGAALCLSKCDLGASYEDIPGYCNSATIDRAQELDYVLTPGRFVGLAEEEEKLNALILENLKKVKL